MFSKNRVFVIILNLLIIIFAVSCTVKPVELKNIGELNIKEVQNKSVTLEVSATIANPNPRLKIKSSGLVISIGETRIGTLTQLDNIVLKGNSTHTYITRVKLDIAGSSMNMMSIYRLFERNKKGFKLSGKVKIIAPFYSKTLNISDYKVFD
jgi:hypothetical protein